MIAARERLDSRCWDQLARELGIRLPYSGYALTTAKATRFLKRLGLTTEQYTVWTAKPFRRNIAKQAETWDYRSWWIRTYGNKICSCNGRKGCHDYHFS